MPEFFLELFSEEIPARMQRDASIQLERICNDVLRSVKINLVETFYGPRRIAIKAHVTAKSDAKIIEERGPRDTAPDAALAGFLGKHKASREEVLIEGGYYWLRRNENPVAATELIAAGLPPALAKFSWPKSMRWGQGGDFTWVRPLRRVVCLLDGEVIPFKLGPVNASNETEGHRFLAPGVFTVSSAADWEEKLKERFVIADYQQRRDKIIHLLTESVGAHRLTVAHDEQLIDEVTGLVEWPVALVGKIDQKFMDLPPEVRELSMKVNQRYFALRDEGGKPAPYFAFVANIEARDNGKAIVAGNERVLRARLSDARHFWDLDLKTPLNELLPQLDKIVFHAKIGTQGDRVKRIARLAVEIATLLKAKEDEIDQAQWAGLLSKADLVTGMVGEFPELQGTMGGYYAKMNPNGWDGDLVGPAIRSHYQPKGPNDVVPMGLVPVSVALADKIDTLREFFGVDEKPSGSSDPYALRRAALGVIRIILENGLHLRLRSLIGDDNELFDFIIERLRVKLRNEGQKFDVLDAVISIGSDDDLVRIMQRVTAVSNFLLTGDGTNLLAAYKRGISILRNEEAKDHRTYIGPIIGELIEPEEICLAGAIRDQLTRALTDPDGRPFADFTIILQGLSKLNLPVNAFLEKVLINDPVPQVRENRLRLLGQLRLAMHQIADFSKIEG
jgi:glycyl-tRNA synthetase beta chain